MLVFILTFRVDRYVPINSSAIESVALDVSKFPLGNVTCYNLEGVDPRGQPFSTRVSVPAGRVQPLWLGVTVPVELAAGAVLSGTIVFSDAGNARAPATTVTVALTVSEEPPEPGVGDDDPLLYTRLRWLNSNLGIDHEVVAPYQPITVQGGASGSACPSSDSAADPTPVTVSILNRNIALACDGLPVAIDVTSPASSHGVLPERHYALLRDGGVRLELHTLSSASPVVFTAAARPTVRVDGPGTVVWWSVSSAKVNASTVTLNVSMTLSLEGYVDAVVTLSASPTPVNVSDIRLIIPVGTLHGLTRMGMNNEALPLATGGPIAWRWSAPTHMSSSVWVRACATSIFCAPSV